MKTKSFFLTLILICFIGISQINAQALVQKDDTWGYMGYVSFDAHEVITPDGTVNLRVNFQFDLTHPMILDAIANGPYQIDVPVYGHIDDYYYSFIATATVYPNGRVKINGHAENYFEM